MEYPLVSIVTVNFNHSDVTCCLLDSLRKITYRNIEIIVVDNASPKDTPLVMKENYPEITLILNEVNTGFAGGNNTGIRISKGKYILMINNDTEVEPGFLEPLVAKFESNPKVGAVSPKIKFHHSPEILQFTGQAPINPYTTRSHGYGFGQKDVGQFEKDSLTNFVHGAAMMVSREVIMKVGLMAESYFLYYEELDWGGRIAKAGYELWYVHNSMILHKESISTGKMSPFKTYYMNRSRLLYMRRNISGLTFLIAIIYQLFISIPKNALVFMLKGSFGHLKAYNDAILWNAKNMFSADIHKNPGLND
jgi:GT2 family glycosyltransferase